MFASQLSEIMSTVLRIGKKYPDMEVQIPRYGSPMPDKILASLLDEMDKRLDLAHARLEAAQEQIKVLSSAPEVRAGEL